MCFIIKIIGHFSNLFGKFPKSHKHTQVSKGIREIWGILQMSGNLTNSQNSRESGEFPKFLRIRGLFIFQL